MKNKFLLIMLMMVVAFGVNIANAVEVEDFNPKVVEREGTSFLVLHKDGCWAENGAEIQEYISEKNISVKSIAEKYIDTSGFSDVKYYLVTNQENVSLLNFTSNDDASKANWYVSITHTADSACEGATYEAEKGVCRHKTGNIFKKIGDIWYNIYFIESLNEKGCVIFKEDGRDILVNYNPDKLVLCQETQVTGLAKDSDDEYCEKYAITDEISGESPVFFVCKNCSICFAWGCNELVAINGQAAVDAGANSLMLSEYCAKHTCGFFWEVKDSIEVRVGLDKGYAAYESLNCDVLVNEDTLFCSKHKCKSCSRPIAGANMLNGVDGSVNLYSGSNEEYYTDYCVAHMCLNYFCNSSAGNVTSGDVSGLSLYCEKCAKSDREKGGFVCDCCGVESMTEYVTYEVFDPQGEKKEIKICAFCVADNKTKDLEIYFFDENGQVLQVWGGDYYVPIVQGELGEVSLPAWQDAEDAGKFEDCNHLSSDGSWNIKEVTVSGSASYWICINCDSAIFIPEADCKKLGGGIHCSSFITKVLPGYWCMSCNNLVADEEIVDTECIEHENRAQRDGRWFCKDCNDYVYISEEDCKTIGGGDHIEGFKVYQTYGFWCLSCNAKVSYETEDSQTETPADTTQDENNSNEGTSTEVSDEETTAEDTNSGGLFDRLFGSGIWGDKTNIDENTTQTPSTVQCANCKNGNHDQCLKITPHSFASEYTCWYNCCCKSNIGDHIDEKAPIGKCDRCKVDLEVKEGNYYCNKCGKDTKWEKDTKTDELRCTSCSTKWEDNVQISSENNVISEFFSKLFGIGYKKCTNKECDQYNEKVKVTTKEIDGKEHNFCPTCKMCVDSGCTKKLEEKKTTGGGNGTGGSNNGSNSTPSTNPATCQHNYPVPDTVTFTNINDKIHLQMWNCTNCNSPQAITYDHLYINGECVCGEKTDSEAPEIEIVKPEDIKNLDGGEEVVIKLTDNVALKSITYKCFWTEDKDTKTDELGGETSKEITLEKLPEEEGAYDLYIIELVDEVGNKIEDMTYTFEVTGELKDDDGEAGGATEGTENDGEVGYHTDSLRGDDIQNSFDYADESEVASPIE